MLQISLKIKKNPIFAFRNISNTLKFKFIPLKVILAFALTRKNSIAYYTCIDVGIQQNNGVKFTLVNKLELKCFQMDKSRISGKQPVALKLEANNEALSIFVLVSKYCIERF